jgi:hypothetical protein
MDAWARFWYEKAPRLRARLHSLLVLACLAAIFSAPLHAQTETPFGAYSLRNGWSVFTEYSPDSTHIFLGISQDREFLSVGLAWHHRLLLNRVWELSWTPAVRPLMAESDPVRTAENYNVCVFPNGNTDQPCTPMSGFSRYIPRQPVLAPTPQAVDESGSIGGQPYYTDYTYHYGRRWTWVPGLSPVGFQAAFFPRSRLQPLFEVSGGFAASLRDIPLFGTSAFNFTFSFGTGVRIFHTLNRATEIEFRVQHFSNGYLGTANDPGIDSRMIRMSYVWGSQ